MEYRLIKDLGEKIGRTYSGLFEGMYGLFSSYQLIPVGVTNVSFVEDSNLIDIILMRNKFGGKSEAQKKKGFKPRSGPNSRGNGKIKKNQDKKNKKS